MSRNIAFASDHGGFELKNHIMAYLKEQGYNCVDFGSHSEESCDYPDYAVPACNAVLGGECECALLFCGTGVGISIAANKLRGIRACCCSDTFSAEMTRAHNDANALCLGGRVVGFGLAEKLVDAFLSTSFMEGGNHRRRIDKIAAIEAEQKL
ncbi:ribose 5-phosphate isomerase B [Ruminococcaceae bacterium OttesenSCG-928-D13]|nr:ribose 5-phosphate isomerase B [Ruminococcaceae bacterium OttesenSCG-928-D13]